MQHSSMIYVHLVNHSGVPAQLNNRSRLANTRHSVLVFFTMLPLCTLLWTSFIAAICVFLVSFWSKIKHFRDAGIPFVMPLPLVGNLGKVVFRRAPLVDVFSDIYNVSPQSKYVGFFDLVLPCIVIRDPELIKEIAIRNADIFINRRGFVDETCEPFLGKGLFQLKGQRWQKTRATLSPSFTGKKMRNMFGLMSECAVDFSDFIRDSMADQEINLKDIFSRYTNDVIASCAFGIKMDSMRHPKNEFYVLGKKTTNFDGFVSLKFFLTRNFPTLTRLLGIKIIGNRMIKFFTSLVSSTIRTRDEKNITRPDMLQLMMETRGTDNELSEEEMAAQAVGFFFAGFDTTSTVMCFVAHMLATHPQVYKKLQEEIDLVWENTSGEPTYEDISDMEYLEAVLSETLRLQPPGLITERDCTKPFELPPHLPGEKPYILKPGMNVWFPIFNIQHDPKYYPEPEKFIPERFLKKKVSASDMTFTPFGMGPRICIANRFAMLEMKVAFYYLMLKCQFKVCSKTRVPFRYSKKSFIPFAEGGFWLKFQPRVLFT